MISRGNWSDRTTIVVARYFVTIYFPDPAFLEHLMPNFRLNEQLEQEGWSAVYDPALEVWGIYSFKRWDVTICIPYGAMLYPLDRRAIYNIFRGLIKNRTHNFSYILFGEGSRCQTPPWLYEICYKRGISIHFLEKDEKLPRALKDYRFSRENCTASNMPSMVRVGEVHLYGRVMELQEHTNYRGSRLCFVLAEDRTGSFNIVLFAKDYAKYANLLRIDAQLLFTGRVRKFEALTLVCFEVERCVPDWIVNSAE
jgi:hypothetical protein